MVQGQLNKHFGGLSAAELLHKHNSVLSTLLKVRKSFTREDAENFIEETLTKLIDPEYRERFTQVLLGINPSGLALSNSFQKKLKGEMTLKLSIYTAFKNAENQKRYEESGMKDAIHNARGIFASMPYNSVTTKTI